MDLLGPFMTLFTILLAVGIIAVAIFFSRRLNNQIMDSTKFGYLKYSGIDGDAKLVSLEDTGRTLANVYTIQNAEIEITSLNPSVKTKTQVAFLKNKVPEIGSMVKVKYDKDNPKIAMVVV